MPNRSKNLLTPGNVVLVSGRISEREDREPELICDSVKPLPEDAAVTRPAKMKSGLYLRVEETDTPVFAQVRELLLKYTGEASVYVVCTRTNRRLVAPRHLWVQKNPELLEELQKLLGNENVKWVD